MKYEFEITDVNNAKWALLRWDKDSWYFADLDDIKKDQTTYIYYIKHAIDDVKKFKFTGKLSEGLVIVGDTRGHVRERIVVVKKFKKVA